MTDAPKTKINMIKNAKARVFLAIGLIIVAVAAIGFIVHWHNLKLASQAAVSVSGGPDISSTPGAGNPSAAYVKAQSDANLAGEEQARQSATAFVPTITRPGFVGSPNQFGSESSGQTKPQCGVNKVVLMYKPNPESCTAKNLELARRTGVTAEELLCQGCACPSLKMAGYSVGDLKNIGMTATQLRQCGFNLQDLVDAGFSPADLKSAGFSAAQLKDAGFSAGELKSAGFSENDLKNAGFSPSQIKDAGFDANASDASAKPESLAEIEAANANSPVCNIAELKKERAAGVSATELHKKGCGLAALKAAGFTAAALRDAGFTAGQLKNAGFSAGDLRAAGFSAAQLKKAGYSAAALKDAGFSAQDLKDAGFSAGDLKGAGFSPQALKDAGFSAGQLRAAGFTPNQLKNAGFSAQDLRAAGYSAGQLAAAGYSPSDLRAAGFSAKQLRDAGLSAADLRAAGFKAADLKAAGFSNGDLVRAGLAPTELNTAAEVEPDSTQPNNNAALPSITGNSVEAKLAAFEKRQQAEMSAQQKTDHIQRTESMMNQQASKLLTAWSNVSEQQLQNAPQPTQNNGNGSGASSTNVAGKAGQADTDGQTMKAGSVLFAVIDTSINSDEKTPILAHIVAGPLNGAKLLGAFDRRHKKLLITFTLLNDPHYPKSIPINAVAIDPDTARTALAGSVDDHYLLRYGTLFASSFLEGIAQGIMNTGVTSTCLVPGLGCTLQQVPLDTNQQIMVGFGKVGQAYGQHMGENFNRPPTIRVAAGTGIGVLIMSDLSLPSGALPNQLKQGGYYGR